ncbi:MAG: hypothetical protein R3286_20615, partial [Gammaproteobacteria bacterium]|nr:hypothetical protein [Gammaproteobacteria bacterium]
AGRPVCPAGPGPRRDDATLVSIAAGVGRLRIGGVGRLLPLPAGNAGAVGAMRDAQPSAVHLDRRGRLWLALGARGLYLLEGNAWRAMAASGPREVRAIDEDAGGDIWVATADGVHRFDGTRWTRFAAGDDVADARNGLRALADGRVALAGHTGLGLRGPAGFARHTRAGGLDSNHVADVVEGPEGRLWLVHGRWGHGVSWLDAAGAAGRGTADGLFNDDLVHLALDAEGHLWLQSRAGATAVYDARVLLSSRARE